MMFSVLSILLFVASACAPPSEGSGVDDRLLATAGVDFYYSLDESAVTYNLPKQLFEVSGIAWMDNNHLLGVQDENGLVYEYDLTSRKIVRTIAFEGKGDFEDLQVVDDMIYALRSDGTLFAFRYSSEDSVEPEVIKTSLDKKNDTEGLGFNPYSGNLLIACKKAGETEIYKEPKGQTVYEFNLAKKQLITPPFLDITKKQVVDFLKNINGEAPDEDDVSLEFSAIAHNPADGYFYLLAKNMLLVLDRKGTLKATYPITHNQLIQPEGICFAKNGDLFLSSEGAALISGYIRKFTMNKR